ncbi:ribonuclease H-like domain-containing protein [Desulfocurvus sp.]|jgi:hypothetical protein|uniref:ribonuclease H-like domain-containing protein n=1 Tax=Desulfocurvus sp. TaxID=2871698 RepID=UPI0025C35B50|nr:ribonuclease H-like domain-containing protein [Desulfocurvus sp.]MCK9241103.1 ribonuclease H-like domain-containing protein [Desulfocurvus sp.]
MLKHTFCHIPRVGVGTEEKYWRQGLACWDDALAGGAGALGPRATWVRQHLEQSCERLAAGDALWFARRLPSGQDWRLFADFRHAAAYVDIETTGLSRDGADHVTTIALYGGGRVRTYVHGRDLERFADDIRRFSLLVTFNGKSFDVPFLRRDLGIDLDMAHIDLRHVLRRVGLSGGLKAVERQLGLARQGLDGVDGYFAVLLWHEYRATGNPAALETLLAYNAADVVGLEPLMVHAWNALVAGTPHGVALRLPAPGPPAPVPHRPDAALVAALRRRHGL